MVVSSKDQLMPTGWKEAEIGPESRLAHFFDATFMFTSDNHRYYIERWTSGRIYFLRFPMPIVNEQPMNQMFWRNLWKVVQVLSLCGVFLVFGISADNGFFILHRFWGADAGTLKMYGGRLWWVIFRALLYTASLTHTRALDSYEALPFEFIYDINPRNAINRRWKALR